MEPTPLTQLVRDLQQLGLAGCSPLVVHSSYRALKPVEDGPRGVVEALRLALTGSSPDSVLSAASAASAASAVSTGLNEPGATLLVPTFTTNLTDPQHWPTPVEGEDRAELMRTIPEFNPATSRPHKMGAISEAVLDHPEALRSEHPVTSWAAIGPEARAMLEDHDLDDPEGPRGPVGKAYAANGWILLLGVSNDANTSVHLAESLLDMPHLRLLPDHFPMRDAEGKRIWRPIAKTTKCSDGFLKLDSILRDQGIGREGRVGRSDAKLYRSRELVGAVMALLRREPAALLCDDPTCVHCPTSRAALERWRAPR